MQQEWQPQKTLTKFGVSDKVFEISLFDHKRDSAPKPAERTWQAICERVKSPLVRANKDGALFSPAIFNPPRRKKENVTEVSLLVLDYDHAADFDRDTAIWRGQNLTFAAYTTHSSYRETESNPNAEERFRVILPLAEPIPKNKFPALWRWAERISDGKIDASAKDSSRMFYTPAIASVDARYRFDFHDGDLLDWRKLDLDAIGKQMATQPTSQNFDAYGQAALREEAAKVLTANNGSRNNQLNQSAFSLGQLAAAGILTESEIEATLERAAVGAGLGITEARATINSGLNAGLSEPRLLSKTSLSVGSHKALPVAQLKNSDSDSEQLLPVVRMADVQAKKVDWLWANRIALHSLTILEGIEGVGKSTLLCAIATGITRGQGLPESEPVAPANVLWLSAEDDLERVLKPRLEAAGADSARVLAIGEPFTLDERGLFGLRAAIATHSAKLVIIDPIFAFTRGDANRGHDSRALTSELKRIAEQFACSICLVRHVGKSKGLGDPRAAGLYSIEWRAAARSVLLIGADPDQPHKRAITQTKNNLGPPAGSLGYVIESDPDSPSGARFYWTGQSDLTAERILSQVRNDGEEEATGRREAVEFLKETLADGPRPAKEIQTEARQCGISERTLNRAKAALGVQSKKQGGTFGGRRDWLWELPAEDCQPVPEDCHILKAGNLQANSSRKNTYANDLAEDCQSSESGNLQREVGNLQQRD